MSGKHEVDLDINIWKVSASCQLCRSYQPLYPVMHHMRHVCGLLGVHMQGYWFMPNLTLRKRFFENIMC